MSRRRLAIGIVAGWCAVVALALGAWWLLRDPSSLPPAGSLGGRLLALLGRVAYDDPALAARVRVSRVALMGTFACVAALGVLERERVLAAVGRYFTAASHPINLAIFRIVVFLQAYKLGYFHAIARTVALPAGLQEPPRTGIPAVGALAVLSRWPLQPLGPSEVLVLGQIMKVACVTAMLGLLTRVSGVVVAVTLLFGWGAAQWYGKVDHHHHVLWFVLVLAASRSGDALSVDSLIGAWRRGRRGDTAPPTEDAAYGVPLRMCILLMGVAYFFPGFWKLWQSGFDWFLGDNPLHQMYNKWYILGGWMPAVRPDRYPLVVHAGALATVLFELSFLFLIFGRRTFLLAGAAGVMFHTTLNYFFRYGFETLRNTYVAFVNWHRGFVWAGRRLFRRRLLVAYDPTDARTAPLVACARSLDWLEAMDWRATGEAPAGSVRFGREGARAVAARLPLLWPAVPFLYLVPRSHAPLRPASAPRRLPQAERRLSGAVAGPLVVGSVLLVGNVAAGMGRLQDSWPLACYPLFDGILDDTYTELRVVAVDGAGRETVLVPDDYRTVFGNNWNHMLRRVVEMKDERQRGERLRLIWSVMREADPSIGDARRLRFYLVRAWIRPDIAGRPAEAPQPILTVDL